MPYITKQFKFCAAHKYWNDSWNDDKNKDVFDDDVKLHGHNYDLYVTVSDSLGKSTSTPNLFKSATVDSPICG